MSPSLASRPFVAASGFKPARAPAVNHRSVTCPTCRAAVSKFCITRDGTPTASSHRARKRMATRAFNERSVA